MLLGPGSEIGDVYLFNFLKWRIQNCKPLISINPLATSMPGPFISHKRIAFFEFVGCVPLQKCWINGEVTTDLVDATHFIVITRMIRSTLGIFQWCVFQWSPTKGLVVLFVFFSWNVRIETNIPVVTSTYHHVWKYP